MGIDRHPAPVGVGVGERLGDLEGGIGTRQRGIRCLERLEWYVGGGAGQENQENHATSIADGFAVLYENVMRIPALIVLIACSTSTEVAQTPEVPFATVPPSEELVPSVENEAVRPTGSSTVIPGPAGSDLFMVDPLLDRVVHVRDDGTTVFPVGTEPTRLTRVDQALFITSRGSGELVKTDLQGQVLQRADVGLEPFGVVADSRGDAVFVAVSLGGEVLELDTTTLEVRRRWSFPNEPRYLAIDEDAGVLYVGEARGERPLHRIDLQSGVAGPSDLPPIQRGAQPLRGRITGDMWVVPSTGELLTPVLYIDDVTPVFDPESPEPQAEAEGYGSEDNMFGIVDVGRFNPSVVVTPPQGAPRALFAAVREGRGYLSSVRSSPDDSLYLATAEGLDALVYLDPGSRLDTPLGPAFELTPSAAGFEEVPLAFVGAPPLPTGVTWSTEGPITYSTRSRTYADGLLLRAQVLLNVANDHGSNANEIGFWTPTASLPDIDPRPTDVIEGEALFYSAKPGVVGGGGVSCATCHNEGRDDGVTWPLIAGPTQTPSLAGIVSETTPVTWSDAVPTVADEALATASLRMGGGVSNVQAGQIQAFVDWTRPVVRSQTEAAERGRLIFERPDVGCTACHNGDRLTDGLQHTFRGRLVATPSLNGVGATAPYLRDGSALDLYDAVEQSLNGGMGNTATLAPDEIDDLVAYLREL